ncbi:FCD domain-containing protein [Paraburkholderia sp. J41]|uniref:FCD domain-containing protein n=1 Tax=Paraburkholderia sp. J41 TaxID=2805433 RepID=UPI002AC34DE3|nr:FCD domain-containing protein [Paraburkholderia sp. J41]
MQRAANSLELLRSVTLSGLVQEEILRRIKTGELQAGMKLNEMDLADHLKISRSPVREAFRALEEAGLVWLEKNRGVYIREISEAEAAELYEVRAGLDEMAGRRLAPVIADAELDELRGMLDQLEASSKEGELNDYFTLNIAFHDRLVELAGNATMLALYRQVINRMHLLRRRGFSLSGSSRASHDEHRKILEALASRDPEAVARTMREHVESGYRRARTAGAQEGTDLVNSAPERSGQPR